MENSSNKPLVVVLSRNYATGISVIRSLGEAEFDVDLVASAFREGNSEMAACSKYVCNAVEVVSRKVSDSRDVDLEAALYRYRRVQDRQIVLFPTDDYTTSVMDNAKNELKDFMIMPQIIGGGPGSLTHHMDKTVQGDMARRAGILTPMEWIISLADEMLDIPEDMVYPCFVKPIESVSGYKREMARCDNRNELIKHLRKLQGNFANRSVLVQEFLEIEGEIDFSGVCLDQEVIIPAIIKKTSVAKYEKGVTLAGQVVPFEELGDLQDNIIAMMKSFHYFGMFDFELAIAGGKLYFNEVNLRSGGPNFAYFMSGVNLPALFVNEALGLGHRTEDEQVEEYGKSFVYEKIAWEDYIHGCITRGELRRIINNADITLLHYDKDPAPGEYFDKVNRADLHKQRRKNFWNNIGEIMLFFRAFFYSTKQLISRLRHGYPQIKRCNRRDPNAERPRVLVVGRNYCSNLTMARSLGEAGYEVEVLRIFQTKPRRDDKLRQKLRPDAYSKYIKAYHEIVTRRKNWRTKRKLINIADPDRKMLLIPADDLVAYIVDHYYDELKEYYIMPNVNDTEGEIGRLMEKETQKQLARQAGLPVLNSCVIAADHGKVDNIPDTVTYPCFVKPNVSKNSAKSKMARCDDERSLRKALRTASRHKYVEMLVEDYVEIDKEYSILGVSTKDGAIGPGYFVAEKGGQEEHRGVAVMGRTLPTDDNQQLIDDIVRFISTLGFDGLFDVDLIKTTDGKMYFVELNMRFGASGYAFTKSGVNLPGMFADYMLLGKPLDMSTKVVDTGKTFVSEKVLIDEYAGQRITKAEMDKLFAEADIHFIMDDDDPQAYNHFKKHYATAANMIKAAHRQEKRILKKRAKMLRREERLGVLRHYPQSKPENRRNPNAAKPRVLVSGRNYCSNLTMARSLGEAGYEVEVLRIFQTKPTSDEKLRHSLRPDAYSKYIKAYHELVSYRKNWRIKNKLVELADLNNKMLLIPADDLVASVADHYYDELSEYYVMPNVNDTEGEINRLMEKHVQKKLARKAGLPVLHSCVVSAERGKIDHIPDSINYPCFVKPDVSKNSAKSQMARCNNERELRKALEKASRFKYVDMLVEDYVEIDKEYSILGVSTRNGVIGPGYFVAEKGGQEEHRGVAVMGRTLPTDDNQQLIDDIVRFISTLGFDGLFDVDLIKTTDGKMYFVELNMRFGASGYAFTKSGVNLPGMFADYMLLGKPLDMSTKVVNTGKTFVSEKVLIDEYAGQRITKAEMDKLFAEADIHFIMDDDDPQAYDHFKKHYATADEVIRDNQRLAKKEEGNRAKLLRKEKERAKRHKFPQTVGNNADRSQSDKPRVLLAGRNYCSNLTMARSLGEAGYDVEVLRIYQVKPKWNNWLRRGIKADAYSKYIKAYYECISNRDSDVIVQKLIELADPQRKMLLIPVDDLVGYIADDNYDLLKNYYIIPNVNDTEGELCRLMEKETQKQLAREAGLPVLNSCVVSANSGVVDNIPDSIHYPCFIKPNVSKNSSKSQMRRCNSRRELINALKKASRRKNVEMLAEDYVVIEKEYSILGVSTKDGAIGPGYFVAEKGGELEHRGVAVMGRTLPTSVNQKLIDDIVAFVGSLGYEGLFDVDLVEAVDGTIYFVELNMRFGASGYAFTKSGVNLPGMFADYMLLGKPLDMTTAVEQTDKTFVSEKVLIEEYAGGRMSRSVLNDILDTADIHFVADKDDPRAYAHFKKYFAVAGVMARLSPIAKSAKQRLRQVNRKTRRFTRIPRAIIRRVIG